MAEVTLEMLQALVLRVLDEQKETRRDVADIRGLTLALSDKVQRLERAINEVKRDMHEVKDDLWIMLKSELMGRQGHDETRLDARLDAFEDRLAAVEARPVP